MTRRNQWLATTPACLLLAVTAACAGGDGAQWLGTVTDSAGVQIVMNPPTGVWSAGETPTVVEELKIGSSAGDPNYQFGSIVGIDVGSDGSIYVLDQQAVTIRVYDAAGTYVRSLGRRGSGPGELSAASFGMIVTAGDTLLVPDMGQQRVTRFAPDGTPIGSFPIPFTEGVSVRWAVGPDGRIVQQARLMNFPGQAPTNVEPKDLLLERDAAGAVIDTLMTLPIGETLKMTEDQMTIRLFEPEPLWGLGDKGLIYFAMNSDYSIGSYNSDGQLQQIIRKDVERRLVTETDQQAFIKVMRDLMQSQGAGAPPEAIEAFLSGMQFAEYYPAFANLMGGPGGSLWVQRIQAASDLAESSAEFNPQDLGSPIWDVFDAEGRYLGELRMPDRFTPMRVLGNVVYGMWRDDLDVQHVLRLRVNVQSTTLSTEGQVGD